MQNTAVTFAKWFYWDAPKFILNLTRDFLFWAWQMFSVGFFIPRIFSPWHRDITGYGRGFDLGIWTRAIVFNGISRIFGAIFRLCSIAAGLMMEVIIMAIGLVVFVGWVIMPLTVIYLALLGFGIL